VACKFFLFVSVRFFFAYFDGVFGLKRGFFLAANFLCNQIFLKIYGNLGVEVKWFVEEEAF